MLKSNKQVLSEIINRKLILYRILILPIPGMHHVNIIVLCYDFVLRCRPIQIECFIILLHRMA